MFVGEARASMLVARTRMSEERYIEMIVSDIFLL